MIEIVVIDLFEKIHTHLKKSRMIFGALPATFLKNSVKKERLNASKTSALVFDDFKC